MWFRQFTIAILYLLFGYATQQLIPNSTQVSILWPGSGLALGVVLFYGLQYIFGIFGGALLLSVITYDSYWAIGGVALANTLEAYFGYWLLNRQAQSLNVIRSFYDYLKLLLLGAGVAGLVGVSLGTAALLLSGNIDSESFFYILYRRWMGHAIGIVLGVPLMLAWLNADANPIQVNNRVRIENASLIVLTLFIGQIVFMDWFHSSIGQIAKGYWMFLFVVWIAMKTGQRGVTLMLLLIGIQALVGALNNMGFFSDDLAQTGLHNYWYYMLILSIVGIALVTYVQEIRDRVAALRIKDCALNAAANAIVITDATGRIEWANHAFTQMTGYSLDEAYLRNPRDLVKSGKHSYTFYKMLWDTILANKVWRNELVNRRKDGALYDEDMTITPMTNESGTISHFVAVKQDISERKQAEKRIAYSESMFRGLFENMRSGVAIYTAVDDGKDFIFKDVNHSVERLEKTSRNALIGKSVTGCFPAIKAFGLFDVLQRVWRTGKSEFLPVSFYHDDRISAWYDNQVYRLPSGEVVAIYDDVTEKMEAETALNKSNQQMSSLLNSMAEGAYGVDVTGKCTFANRAFLSILGYGSESEVLGKQLHELIHHSYPNGNHYPASECLVHSAYKTNHQSHSIKEYFWRKDGTGIPVEFWSQPILLNDAVVGAIVTFVDITERLKSEQKIQNLAFYDGLTKLANRTLLSDRLDQVIAQSKRSNRYIGLILLDLDNFKPLNDTHGHGVGDILLIEAAKRLKACVREVDTVARFGGDEFVVLLGELDTKMASSISQATSVAEKIRVSLSSPYLLTKHDDTADVSVEHHCTASIGVYVFNSDASGQDDILNRADAAMYQAKEAGRNTIRFYDAEI